MAPDSKAFLQGLELHGKGDYLGACEAFHESLGNAGPDADTFLNLGKSLQALGQYNLALASFRRSLVLRPDDLESLTLLGNLLLHLDRLEEASEAHQKALSSHPDDHRVLNNLGSTFLARNLHREALVCFEKAARLAPTQPACRHNAALANLALGEFRQGWELLESRFETDDQWRQLRAGAWSGETPAAKGESLLVLSEQGIGDTLQFLRYLPALSKLGFELSLIAHPSLQRLLSAQPGLKAVYTLRDLRPEFAHYTFLMSLPLFLRKQLGDQPPPPAPLQVPHNAGGLALASIRQTYPKAGRIGLVWAGNHLHPRDHKRSIPLETLASALAGLPCHFHSLQKEVPSRDRDCLHSLAWLNDLGPDLTDFADTAACILELDTIVCVDTAVAHLAATLGKPVFLLLPFAADWRWQSVRPDSPWYRSMRLLRQDAPGDWSAPLRQLREALFLQA